MERKKGREGRTKRKKGRNNQRKNLFIITGKDNAWGTVTKYNATV